MADRTMRQGTEAFDWSTTPLGPRSAWSDRLNAYVDVMLGSQFACAICWGPDLHLLHNDAYKRRGHPEGLGQPLREAWPELYAQVAPLVDSIFAGESCLLEDVRVEAGQDGMQDEALRTVSWSPLRDGAGAIAGMFATIIDPTAKAAKAARRGLVDRLAQLFDNATTFMALLAEPAHIIEYANPVFHTLAGDRELIGKSIRAAFPELEEQGLLAKLDEVYQTGRMFRAEGVRASIARSPGQPPDIRYMDVLAQPVPGPDGRSTGLFLEGVDVTERYLAEDALRESRREAMEARAHLDLMFRSAVEFAIMAMDVDGLVISWSPGAQRIFGYTESEAIGQTYDIFYVPEDREAGVPAHELRRAATNNRSPDERFHVRKDGERFYASGVTAAMRDDSGNLRGFVKIARDMSAQKRAEDEIIAAKNAAQAANLAKSDFLANMSHEIRTPMNAIVGLTNLLPASGPLSDRQKQYLATLKTSADSLLALINDLLDIAKVEARATELEHIPFSLADILHEVSSMMSARSRDKGLDFTISDGCVYGRTFLGDPNRIRQILLNLSSNAVKFTDKGGVDVSVQCEPHPAPDMETIRISVRDTGIGIAQDKLGSIFDKFTQADNSITRRFGGTGLGLAITKALVQVMDGEITVCSAPGAGSTFTVRLPLTVAHDRDLMDADLSLPVIVQDMQPQGQVLLVEDNPANVMVAASYLERFGYRVDVAETGGQALEKVKQNRYDAVVMDVQMPGMDGLETTRTLRQQAREEGAEHVPIIGMTAHAMAGDRERCLAAGMDDYIAKPFNPADLQARLKTLVDRA